MHAHMFLAVFIANNNLLSGKYFVNYFTLSLCGGILNQEKPNWLRKENAGDGRTHKHCQLNQRSITLSSINVVSLL